MARSVNKEPRFPGLMSEENVPAPKQPTTPTPPLQPAKKQPSLVRVQHMMAPAMIEALDAYCEKYETSRSNAIRDCVREMLAREGFIE